MVTIKISEKGGQQSSYEFDKSEVTIGRMKGNDIVLPKGNVSKKHARIYDRGGSLTINDLDSTNGTYVNGRRVTSEQELSESDKIYIGDFILQVRPERQQAPPEAPPQPPGSQQEQGSSQSGGGSGGGSRSPSSPPRGDGGASSSAPADHDPLQEKYNSSQSGARQRSRENSRSGSRSGGGGRGDPESSGVGGGARNSTRRDSSVDEPSSNRSSDPQNRHASSPPGGERDRQVSRSNRSGRRSDDPGSSGVGRSSDSNDVTSSNRSASRGGGNDRSQSGVGSQPSRPPGGGRKRRDDDTSPPDSGPSNQGSGGVSRHDSAPSDASSPSASPERHSTRQDDPDPSTSSDEAPEADEPLSSDRRRRAHVSVPEPSFRSNFDRPFHEHQRSVADTLFDNVDRDELPTEVSDDERDRFRDFVLDAIEFVDPPVDHDELTDLLLSECIGLGPLESHLDDEDLRRIHVDAYDRIVLEYDDETVRARRAFSHPDLLEAVARRLVGDTDASGRLEEAQLDDGTFVRLVPASVAVDGPALTLEMPRRDSVDLDTLVREDALSEPMRSFLERAIDVGRSILVAGPAEAELGRVLEALARSIPEGTRIAAVEETPRLELPHETVVQLQSSVLDGDEPRAVRAAETMRVERILLDPSRGREAEDWVRAAAGTHGSMATVRGSNVRDALDALEHACLSSPRERGPRSVRRQIARAVDLVVFVAPSEDGSLRMRQISEVRGVELDDLQLEDVFYFDDEEGMGGDFEATGYVPLFYEDLRHAGFEVDFEIFRE